jgi:hypothetical protein
MAERDYAAMSLDELLKDIEEEKRQRSAKQDELDSIQRDAEKDRQLRIIQDELRDVRKDVTNRLIWQGREYPAKSYKLAQDRTQGRIRSIDEATRKARAIGISFGDLVNLQGAINRNEITWQAVIGQQDRDKYLLDKMDNLTGITLRRDIEKITEQLKLKEEERKRKEKKREQRLWEFTRYYRYISKDNKSNNREFEVRVALPFLADWTENQVKQSQDTIIALCDKALALAWKQTDYADNTYEILDSSAPLEKDWGTPGARGWANGYERKDKTEPLSTSKRVSVEAEVQDKIGKYWKGKLSVIRYWDIPG